MFILQEGQKTSAINIEESATSPALSVFAFRKWEAFIEVVAEELPKNFVLDSELLGEIDFSLMNQTFETCSVILQAPLPELRGQAEPSLATGLDFRFHFNVIRRFSLSESKLAGRRNGTGMSHRVLWRNRQSNC